MARDGDAARTFANALSTVAEALRDSRYIESVEVVAADSTHGRLQVAGRVADFPEARFSVQLDVS